MLLGRRLRAQGVGFRAQVRCGLGRSGCELSLKRDPKPETRKWSKKELSFGIGSVSQPLGLRTVDLQGSLGLAQWLRLA